MIFTDKQFVRWDDLDAMGHVNNATYLTYIQETRFLWLSNVEMVVARAEVDFLEPIYVGGRFVVRDRICRGRSGRGSRRAGGSRGCCGGARVGCWLHLHKCSRPYGRRDRGRRGRGGRKR